jgi:hypothetical protein
MGTLHEYLSPCIICCWILFRMRNISDKSCRDNQNTHCMFDIFSRKSYRFWDNVEKCDRAGKAADDNIIQHMRWFTKATNTHSEYVLFPAFPRQQWLRERAWILHFTYISWLVWDCCTKGLTVNPSYNRLQCLGTRSHSSATMDIFAKGFIFARV